MTSAYLNSKIYLAGHIGLVGSRLLTMMNENGFSNIVYPENNMLDLRDQSRTISYISQQKPDMIILIAGKTRGNKANADCTGEFLYDNLVIAANVIEAARLNNVSKLIFLASASVYPSQTEQPIRETSLLTGPLEPSTEPYAIAKIAGLKLCQYYRKQYNCNFITAIPPNLYGPGDFFGPVGSHVIPAVISRIHEAKMNNLPRITMRGTGKARREFMFVDDVCRGILFLLDNYNDSSPINLGTGLDYSIKDLCDMLCRIIGFSGTIQWDTSFPEGTSKSLLDSSVITGLGWSAQVSLLDGLTLTYDHYLKNM